MHKLKLKFNKLQLKNSNRKNIVSNKLYERCGIERRRNMTHKYISTQMLIIFTALMIIANFYYIFFEKLAFYSFYYWDVY